MKKINKYIYKTSIVKRKDSSTSYGIQNSHGFEPNDRHSFRVGLLCAIKSIVPKYILNCAVIERCFSGVSTRFKVYTRRSLTHYENIE